MELLISGLTITAMMGTVSAATSLANGVYTLSDRIIKSTDSGVADIKRLIESSDLKNRIKIMDMFVREIEINDKTPKSIAMSIESINAAIKDIERELKQIQYRIDYNDSLYFAAGGTRLYKFGNSYKRLSAKIGTLEKRYDTLKSLFSMRNLLNPNKVDTVLAIENGKDGKDEIQRSALHIEEDEKILEKILTHQGDEYHVVGDESE
jgi:hypothetical protein